jgi:thiamine biosynthesis lipoprotein
MTRLEIWFLHLTTALAWSTGLVYAILRYFVKSEDAFGVVNHPLEPHLQHLHILLTPLMVFAIGVIWRRHVWTSWRSGQGSRRRSGIGMALILGPMVLSGYLIQVVLAEGWRAAWVVIHVTASLVWLAGYGFHVLTLRRGAYAGEAIGAGAVGEEASPGWSRWLVALVVILVVFLLLVVSLPHPFARAAAVEESAAEETAVVERRLALMGTVLELSIEAKSRPAGLAASEEAIRAIEATEARLSTWGDASELAQLNAKPVGEWMPLSAELAAELAGAQRWWRETRGAFDPGIGALIQVWGLRDGGRLPQAAERSEAVAAGGMESLELSGSQARRLKPELRLEEGAFGKGAALDRAITALRASGVHRAVIDLGGQIAVLGAREPLPIAIADPRRRERPALLLDLHEGSVSTSGNGERGLKVDGAKVGHILDPRCGEPASDFGSVTVWAPDGLTADCLSTGLFVLGPDAALKFAAERRGVEVLVLEFAPSTDEGKLRARATAGLRGRLRVLAPEVELHFVPGGTTPS